MAAANVVGEVGEATPVVGGPRELALVVGNGDVGDLCGAAASGKGEKGSFGGNGEGFEGSLENWFW